MPDNDSPTSRPRRRLRVLLVAEAANPEWFSVPLEGWSHTRALAERDDLDALVATQVRNRDAFVRAGLVEGRDFVAVDNERVASPLDRFAGKLAGGKGTGWTFHAAVFPLSYLAFEIKLWQVLGDRIGGGEFDLVHRVTPLSPVTPSLVLARRCRRAKVPFVVGPLNGGVPWPKGYDAVRRKEREWLGYVRDAYKLLPGYRATRRHAAALLVGSRDTAGQLDKRYHAKRFYVPENGVDPARFPARRTRRLADDGGPLRIVWVGRMVPYKGADVLVEAAADLIRAGKAHVTLIGDGPQRAELEAMVERDGLRDGVTFAGWVPHDRLQQTLVEQDVLGFPSIREFGGAVVLEAMAVGLAPVVVDYAGPAELVSPQTGRAVEIGPRPKLVERFRATLEAFAADPAAVDALGEAAARRAWGGFSWPAKAEQVRRIYDWVLDPHHAPRPDLPMPLPDGYDAGVSTAA